MGNLFDLGSLDLYMNQKYWLQITGVFCQIVATNKYREVFLQNAQSFLINYLDKCFHVWNIPQRPHSADSLEQGTTVDHPNQNNYVQKVFKIIPHLAVYVIFKHPILADQFWTLYLTLAYFYLI